MQREIDRLERELRRSENERMAFEVDLRKNCKAPWERSTWMQDVAKHNELERRIAEIHGKISQLRYEISKARGVEGWYADPFAPKNKIYGISVPFVFNSYKPET